MKKKAAIFISPTPANRARKRIKRKPNFIKRSGMVIDDLEVLLIKIIRFGGTLYLLFEFVKTHFAAANQFIASVLGILLKCISTHENI